MYHILFHESVIQEIEAFDPILARFIFAWIDKYLQSCVNPRLQGKEIPAKEKDGWCYHIGEYRLLCQIEDTKKRIHVLQIRK